MKTPNLEPSVTTEDILNLTGSVVDTQTGDQEIAACNTHLRVSGGRPVQDTTSPVDSIKYSAFQPLHDEALRLHKHGHFYTGLKIHFGVDKHKNRICLFYQPVCMDNGKDTGPKLRQYSVVEGGWYIYDSTNNVFIHKEHKEFSHFINHHREHTSFMRMDKAVHTRFIPGMDVEAVIFPFQKITSLIQEHPQHTHIALYNSIRRDMANGGATRHTLLLKAINQNPSAPGIRMAAPAAAPGYGNLANLCPPNGASVSFALA